MEAGFGGLAIARSVRYCPQAYARRGPPLLFVSRCSSGPCVSRNSRFCMLCASFRRPGLPRCRRIWSPSREEEEPCHHLHRAASGRVAALFFMAGGHFCFSYSLRILMLFVWRHTSLPLASG